MVYHIEERARIEHEVGCGMSEFVHLFLVPHSHIKFRGSTSLCDRAVSRAVQPDLINSRTDRKEGTMDE